MNELSHLKPASGATHPRKRLGRGVGTGQGKTAGKGHKGSRARAGDKDRPWFEGGQMPLQRRLPKRGFFNPFRRNFVVLNVHQLNRFEDGSVVDVQALLDAGVIAKAGDGVKLLGHGILERTLTVRLHQCSAAAEQKVKDRGGRVEVIRGY